MKILHIKKELMKLYLDENNGRFCITPQFPNGVYAYFATLSNSGAEQGGQFNSYKLPAFPYL